MKHTSVRLSDDHIAMIATTGKSPTAIIKEALDLYFGRPSEDLEPTRKLIEEHVKAYHMAGAVLNSEHKVSTEPESVPHNVPQDVLKNVPTVAHKVSTRTQHEHTMSTEAKTALTLILEELKAGREPAVNTIADKIGLTTTGLGMILSKCGIKSKNTHRDMQTVRLYPKTMRTKIEELLATREMTK